MNGKVFFDTNVLVYAYDNRDSKKQQLAQSLIATAMQAQVAVLSAQVLGEFYVVVTRKIPNPMSPQDANKIIEQLGGAIVVALDFPLVRRAIVTQASYGLSYWDGLIVAAAEQAGCRRIISEDLNHGQKYHSVEIQNPFLRPTE